MKAIKGLEDRLYALDQMIASCGRLVNEQKELAQVLCLAFFVNFRYNVYLVYAFTHLSYHCWQCVIIHMCIHYVCLFYDHITHYGQFKGKEVYFILFGFRRVQFAMMINVGHQEQIQKEQLQQQRYNLPLYRIRRKQATEAKDGAGWAELEV